MKQLKFLCIALLVSAIATAQNTIPIDTAHWDIQARSYVLEKYKGKDAIYLQAGFMKLKNQKFISIDYELDGIIRNEMKQKSDSGRLIPTEKEEAIYKLLTIF